MHLCQSGLSFIEASEKEEREKEKEMKVKKLQREETQKGIIFIGL